MRSKSVLIWVGSTLLVFVAGLALWSTRGREVGSLQLPDPVHVLAPVELDEQSTLDSSTRIASAASESSKDAPPAIAASRLAGQVRVREGNEPLVGAFVRCEHDDVWSTETTDASGRFQFDFEGPVTIDRIEVAATELTASFLERLRLPIPAGGERLHDLWVTRGSTLSGRVVDLEKRAVPGAEVLGWCSAKYDPGAAPDRVATSGVDGSFSLDHVGAHFHAIAQAPGYVCHTGLKGELATAKVASGLEIVLARPGSVRGRVITEGEEPVAAASIELAERSWSSQDDTEVENVRRFMPVVARAATDIRGRFALDGLPLSRTMQSRVEHPAHPIWEGEIAAGDAEVVIQLASGHAIEGRVLAPDGSGVANALIKFRPAGTNTSTISDTSGRFRLRGLASTDKGVLFVHGDGFAAFVETGVVVDADRTTRRDVRLELGLTLAGRVIDRDEQPLAGWNIEAIGVREIELPDLRLVGQATTPEWAFGLDRVASDEQGGFRFVDLVDGEYLLRARSPELPQRKASDRARAGREDVVLRFDVDAEPGVVFVGRVTDAASGAPMREFVVSPIVRKTDHSFGPSTRVENPDGRFRLIDIEEGEIELKVEADGHAPWYSAKRSYTAGRYEFSVALSAERAVHLRAVDGRKQPIAGDFQVGFRALDGRELSMQLGSMSTTWTQLENGEMRANRLPAELIQVVFRSIEQGRDWSFDLDLRTQHDEVIEFVLDIVPLRKFRGVFAGAARGTPLDDLTRERARALFEDKKLWLIDARVEIVFEDAAGRAVARASIEPLDSGRFRTQWNRGSASAVRDELNAPLLEVPLDVEVSRLSAHAAGYAELSATVQQDSVELQTFVLIREE